MIKQRREGVYRILAVKVQESGVIVFTAPDDLLFENGDRSGFGKIHGINDHLFKNFIRHIIALNVQQNVLALYVTAVGEVHSEVELHSEL